MANKKSGKRGSGVIALIAVVAALVAPSAASAGHGKSKGGENSKSAVAKSPVVVGDASWAESIIIDASWAE